MPANTGRLSSHAVATIANGASASDVIDLRDYAIAAIIMPTAWTTAALTFLTCATAGGTFLPVYDDAGTEVSIASANVVQDRAIVNKTILEQLAGLRYIKLRSGVAATPVTQGGDRAITVVMKS